MKAIAEYPPMERERFEREIVAKGEPAVFRGLVADWPIVHAAQQGAEATAEFLRSASSGEACSPTRTLATRHIFSIVAP